MLSRDAVCRTFGIAPDRITDHVAFGPAPAIKFTIPSRSLQWQPRGMPISSGVQQYGPLLGLKIPIDAAVAAAIANDRAVQHKRGALPRYLRGAYRDPDAATTRLDEMVRRQGPTSTAARIA